MTKSFLKLKNLIICALIFSAFVSLPRLIRAQSNSNGDSKSVTVQQTVLDDCSKALDELAVYDQLLESKESEIKLFRERLETEKEKYALAAELADARKNQAEANAEAINSLKAAIAAKDALIVNKDQEIALLKKKKTSILTIIKTVAVGVSIGLVLK